MTNLNPDICRKIREARREAGLRQSVLAREIGCGQSALSMFEQGDGTKLNDEVIKKLCSKFGIELHSATEKKEEKRYLSAFAPPVPKTGFCPNAFCPSHESYSVEGTRFLRPNRDLQDPAGGKFCAVCGEVLERNCPNCGAPVHEGAICSFCGKPYVAV